MQALPTSRAAIVTTKIERKIFFISLLRFSLFDSMAGACADRAAASGVFRFAARAAKPVSAFA
jgi:hypothetical protein